MLPPFVNKANVLEEEKEKEKVDHLSKKKKNEKNKYHKKNTNII